MLLSLREWREGHLVCVLGLTGSDDYSRWLVHSRHGRQRWELRFNRRARPDCEELRSYTEEFDFIYDGECYGLNVCVPAKIHMFKTCCSK